MANLTLNAKTYAGTGVSNGIAMYVERSGGVASAFSPLTVSVRPGSGTSPTKVAWKLVFPVVAGAAAVVPGAVLKTATVDVSIRASALMTTAELTDLQVRLTNLAATAEFTASIASLALPVG